MRPLLFSTFFLVLPACGGDDGGPDGDVVLLDNASDEVLVTMRDLVERGDITTDDDLAAHLTEPADGSEIPTGSAPTFAWTLGGGSLLPHGVNTGDFVWLSVGCDGFDEPIDVLAIESRSWQPDEDRWSKMLGATGPCEVSIVSAYIDRGVASEGLYRPSTSPTFTLAE